MFVPSIIHPESLSSVGILLFPDSSDLVSTVVTNGVEVKASSRWFPESDHAPMNFGYRARMRLLPLHINDISENDHNDEFTRQLVGRSWDFFYEDGTRNQVQGPGAVGKHSLLFRRSDGICGFVDLGPVGNGETFVDMTFKYQSQSGPVPGTSSTDHRRREMH